MAHFRGTLRGCRGQASRLGSKKSGLEARIASWEGAVSVSLAYNAELDRDDVEVYLVPHNGAGVTELLYRGHVGSSPAKSHEQSKDCPECGDSDVEFLRWDEGDELYRCNTCGCEYSCILVVADRIVTEHGDSDTENRVED